MLESVEHTSVLMEQICIASSVCECGQHIPELIRSAWSSCGEFLASSILPLLVGCAFFGRLRTYANDAGEDLRKVALDRYRSATLLIGAMEHEGEKYTKQTQECLERAKKEINSLVQLFPEIKRHCECRGAIECAQWAVLTLVIMFTGIYHLMGPVVVFALYPIAYPFWKIRRLPFAIKELDDTIDKLDLKSKYLSKLKAELTDFPSDD